MMHVLVLMQAPTEIATAYSYDGNSSSLYCSQYSNACGLFTLHVPGTCTCTEGFAATQGADVNGQPLNTEPLPMPVPTQPLEILADVQATLSVLFLLFAFKQHRVRNLSRKKNTVPQGVSVLALWLTFVSSALAGADIFFSSSSAKAYNTIIQAFSDPQAKKYVESAAGSLSLFVNVIMASPRVYRVVLKLFRLAASLTLLLHVPLAVLFGSKAGVDEVDEGEPRKQTDDSREDIEPEERREAASATAPAPSPAPAPAPAPAPRSSAPNGTDSASAASVVVMAVVVALVSGCCAHGHVGGRYWLMDLKGIKGVGTAAKAAKLARAWTKTSAPLLDGVATLAQVAAWKRESAGFCMVHAMLFRALSAGTSLVALQYTGRLFDFGSDTTTPLDWLSLTAPLRRAAVPSLISALVVINNFIAWGPLMYCYVRKMWWALALLAAAVLALVAWEPVLDWGLSQYLHEHVDLVQLWRMFVHGTGRVTTQPLQWPALWAHIALAQVLLMLWVIAFSGGIGIGVVAFLVSLVYHILA